MKRYLIATTNSPKSAPKLRLVQNGKDEKHARLAKDCLAYIAKFIE